MLSRFGGGEMPLDVGGARHEWDVVEVDDLGFLSDGLCHWVLAGVP